MRFSIHIAFETDSTPTDLELGDLLTTLSENFLNPTSESPGGAFVPADYDIDSYDMELYDDKGRRIWRYMYGEDVPDAMIVEHSMNVNIGNKQPEDIMKMLLKDLGIDDDDFDDFDVSIDFTKQKHHPKRDWRAFLLRFISG